MAALTQTQDPERPAVNYPPSCYHEAGHCAMFWHLGIEIDYVTMNNVLGGETRLVPVGYVTGARLDDQVRGAAAGDIACRRYRRRRQPADDDLIAEFSRLQSWALDNITAEHGQNDETNLALAAVNRDIELTEADPAALTGPSRWLPLWHEARVLIEGELWPAVCAIGEELQYRTDRVPGSEVAVLAAAAMNHRLSAPA